jgi:NAD(P)H-hydrate epimerase
MTRWLEPLYDAAQMRATDAWAIEQRGTPSLELMDAAGTALAAAAAEIAPAGRIVVVCGQGNNGGDGLVAARVLREQGREVDVLCTEDAFGGDALASRERLPGTAPQPLPAALPEDAALVIDAVLGTGASGDPRGAVHDALALMNATASPKLSADVPSGVDASTGEAGAIAVRAHTTVTFHAAKPGLWIAPGRRHAGRVIVAAIGIPPGADPGCDAGLIHDEELLALIPRRDADSTKFTSGHVVVAGGSRGLTGAPCLAAEGAMRAGAGYVEVCVPASLSAIFEIRLLEVMSHALPDVEGAHTPGGVEGALRATERGGALVIGPGLGRSDSAAEFARTLLERAAVPVVLDADGLNAFAGRDLPERAQPTVLTPHAGELARLLGVSSEAVTSARLRHAREAAARLRAIVVLKGDDTLVVRPDGFAAVSPGASPALATAGTGDVLAGVTGALLAKGMDPFAAACAAVRRHALAGVRAGERRGDSVIASDVVDAL